MRHPTLKIMLPIFAAAMMACSSASAQFGFGWYDSMWGWPSYYSSYYSPYSSYYPSYSSYYTASYVPSYTASYVPTTTYYAGSSSCCTPCCSTGSCGVQRSCYSSSACCSPCTSCVSCSNSSCCTDCSSGNCDLASSSGSQSGTNIKPRPDAAGARQRTFIDEEDKKGTGEGFQPRNPNNMGIKDGDYMPDTLDENPSTRGREELRIPQAILARRQPAPAHRTAVQQVKFQAEAAPALAKLDDKITTRPMPERTRLIERQSWSEPALAENPRRESSEINLGWIPVPAPTRLVQK